jgi:hypothetical protein
MCASNKFVAIPAPTDDDDEFIIGDVLTIYEAAMVSACRHPYPFFSMLRAAALKSILNL